MVKESIDKVILSIQKLSTYKSTPRPQKTIHAPPEYPYNISKVPTHQLADRIGIVQPAVHYLLVEAVGSDDEMIQKKLKELLMLVKLSLDPEDDELQKAERRVEKYYHDLETHKQRLIDAEEYYKRDTKSWEDGRQYLVDRTHEEFYDFAHKALIKAKEGAPPHTFTVHERNIVDEVKMTFPSEPNLIDNLGIVGTDAMRAIVHGVEKRNRDYINDQHRILHYKIRHRKMKTFDFSFPFSESDYYLDDDEYRSEEEWIKDDLSAQDAWAELMEEKEQEFDTLVSDLVMELMNHRKAKKWDGYEYWRC